MLVGFGAYKGYVTHEQKKAAQTRVVAASLPRLAPDNFVEIYMPPNCGGCPICKGQVANVEAAKIAHQINVLASGEDFMKFGSRIKAETKDESLGGAANPFKMPVMRVNGVWLQQPTLKDLKPHLKLASENNAN